MRTRLTPPQEVWQSSVHPATAEWLIRLLMVGALIETYWRAKTERTDVTRALYRTAVELEIEALIKAFAARVDAATLGMLASASDWKGDDLASVNLTLVTVIFGAVRNAFERDLSPAAVEALRGHMLQMCRAYLGTIDVI